MRLLFPTLIISILPTVSIAQGISFEDGPWIAIPAGMTFDAQLPPVDEIRAMANLDNDPSVTTPQEQEMIALLSQILGLAPLSH